MTCKLRIPNRSDGFALASLQGRIPLSKRLLVSLPMRHETWFHVEHAPIKKPSPAPRTFLDQLMNLGIDDLRRECQSELCQPRRLPSVDPGAKTAFLTLHPHRDAALSRIGLAEDNEPLSTAADEVVEAAGTKGAPPTQQIDGLKNAGLARGVLTTKEGELRIWLELDTLQATEIRHLQASKGHLTLIASWA